jgi:hypothetical protein
MQPAREQNEKQVYLQLKMKILKFIFYLFYKAAFQAASNYDKKASRMIFLGIIQRLIKRIDIDGNNLISFEETCQAFNHLDREHEDILREEFIRADIDRLR